MTLEVITGSELSSEVDTVYDKGFRLFYHAPKYLVSSAMAIALSELRYRSDMYFIQDFKSNDTEDPELVPLLQEVLKCIEAVAKAILDFRELFESCDDTDDIDSLTDTVETLASNVRHTLDVMKEAHRKQQVLDRLTRLRDDVAQRVATYTPRDPTYDMSMHKGYLEGVVTRLECALHVLQGGDVKAIEPIAPPPVGGTTVRVPSERMVDASGFANEEGATNGS